MLLYNIHDYFLLTEINWCGPENNHGMATSSYGRGLTWYAITSQVNIQVNQALQSVLQVGIARVEDDVIRRCKIGKIMY